MGQNVRVQGLDYEDIDKVNLPLSAGGIATFFDTVAATATAADVASGKTAYVNGGPVTGSLPIVVGKFTTASSSGAQSVTIPYDGSGYPIAAMVFPSAGAYDPDNHAAYDTVQQYAIVFWAMTKSELADAPTYATSGNQNRGSTIASYKNSTTEATSYTRAGSMIANTYSSSNASASSTTCIRFNGNKSMSVYVASTSYGLFANMEHTYVILYSG